MHRILIWQTFWLPGSGRVKCVHFMSYTSNVKHIHGLPSGSVVKNLTANAGDSGSIPGSGRSPAEGKATHSSIFAWSIPWTEKPGGLQSVGLQRVGHNWAHTHKMYSESQVTFSPQTSYRTQIWTNVSEVTPFLASSGCTSALETCCTKTNKTGRAGWGGRRCTILIYDSFTVQQKPMPHGKEVILQLKINRFTKYRKKPHEGRRACPHLHPQPPPPDCLRQAGHLPLCPIFHF